MACDPQTTITTEDLNKLNSNIDAVEKYADSEDLTFVTTSGKTKDTIEGKNRKADLAISNAVQSAGWVFLDEYTNDPEITELNQFVSFGTSPNITYWGVKSSVGVPYQIDSTTYPDPSNDTNLKLVNEVTDVYMLDQDLHRQRTVSGGGKQLDIEDGIYGQDATGVDRVYLTSGIPANNTYWIAVSTPSGFVTNAVDNGDNTLTLSTDSGGPYKFNKSSVSNELTIGTVEEMVASSLQAGQKVTTYFYNSNIKSSWVIVDSGAGDMSDGTLLIESGNYAKIVINRAVDPRAFGAYADAGDGVGTDSSVAFGKAMAYATANGLPMQIVGKIRIDAQQVMPVTGLRMLGVDAAVSQVWTNLNDALFVYSNNFSVEGLGVYKDELTNYETARAFSTTTSGALAQAAHCNFDRMEVKGFKYGWWHRTSLWITHKNIITANRCGYRMSRNDFPDDQSNPDAPFGWNSFSPLGWFHNVINIENWRAEDIEVGVMGCPMSITIDTLTCQKQSNPNTGANVVLKTTEPRTGLWLESGEEGSRSNFDINIISFYAEACQRPYRIADCQQVDINGTFAQGNTMASPFQTYVDVSNSIVTVSEATGQDWFINQARLSNGAIIYGSLAGAVTGDKYSTDSDSVLYPRGRSDQSKFDYTLAGDGTEKTYTLSESVPAEKGKAKLYVVGLNDGFQVRTGEATIYSWNAGSACTIEWGSNGEPTNFNLAVSNSGIISITLDASTVYTNDVTLEIVGGTGISSTGTVITGV